MRQHIPPEEKLYTWWSYRAARLGSCPTAAAGSTISGRRRISRRRCQGIEILREARGWERPSDHVPVIARFDLISDLEMIGDDRNSVRGPVEVRWIEPGELAR